METPLLRALSLVCIVLACTPISTLAASACTDVQPPGNYTCAQQKDIGKCKATWMVDGGFCKQTCGVCSSGTSAGTPAPVQEKKVDAVPAPPTDCSDIQPPGNYTCAQQKDLGKCKATWMTGGGFCKQTCGVCTLVPTPMVSQPVAESAPAPLAAPLASAVVAAAVSSMNPPQDEQVAASAADTPAPVPAAEAQRAAYNAALNDAAGELSANGNTGLAVQPISLGTINLPDTAAVPQTPALMAPVVLPTPVAPAPVAGVATTTTPPVMAPVMPIEAAPLAAAVKVPVPASEGAVASAACNATGPTALEALMADPDYSTTVKVVQFLNLAGVLENSGIKFTLFAPTNSAWSSAALSYGVPLDQLLSSRNVVRDILFTHIVPNTILDSATLLTLPSFIPQSGSVVFVAPPAGPGGPAMLVSVASTARIITPDAASGCNYVIHKVDSVMSPNPSPQGGMNPAYQSALARGRASAGR